MYRRLVWECSITDRYIQTPPYRLEGGEASTTACAQRTVQPAQPESLASARGVPPCLESRRTCPCKEWWPAGPHPSRLSRQNSKTRATWPPPSRITVTVIRVDWMDHLLGGTSSWPRPSRGFFACHTKYRFRKLIHSATIANWHFFSPGSPWRARAVRAS